MDYIKLAQRTIAMLSSMIESGECHTTRSREMKDNALNGLEQLRTFEEHSSELNISGVSDSFIDSVKKEMLDWYKFVNSLRTCYYKD